MMDVLRKLKNARKTVIWGAGYHTEEVLRFNSNLFEKTKLIIVDKYKAGQKILDADIHAIDSISFEDVDLVIIMTGMDMDLIVKQLREEFHYNKDLIGLYEFRQQIASLNGNLVCKYHMQQFITHMENGTESYSYDTIFKTKFSKYRVIKVFAYWATLIGESIRYLNRMSTICSCHISMETILQTAVFLRFCPGRFRWLPPKTVIFGSMLWKSTGNVSILHCIIAKMDL
jgi:hypothetical protein